MKRIQTYLKEFRYQQWIKNFVVFLPAFFGSMIFDTSVLVNAGIAFIIFSISASIVYIMNDYKDIEEDRKHPKKKYRPLASGSISIKEAKASIFILLLILIITNIWIGSTRFSIVIFIYLILNITYSFGLKKIPVIEIITVASFYVLRLLGGGILTEITISFWLYLLIFCGSLLFTSGKRLTEKRNSHTRVVLDFYSEKILLLFVILSALASCVFITIYSLNQGLVYIPQTIVFVLAIIRYLYLIQTTSQGESIRIIFDKVILLLLGVFLVHSLTIIYLI